MNRIRELRDAAHISQIELAKSFSVTQSTVSSWEHGKRDPDTDTVKKLAGFFNVSTDYLLGVSDIKKPPTSDEMSGLTDMQIKIIEMMGNLSPDDQDAVLKQAEFLTWQKQQKKGDV